MKGGRTLIIHVLFSSELTKRWDEDRRTISKIKEESAILKGVLQQLAKPIQKIIIALPADANFSTKQINTAERKIEYAIKSCLDDWSYEVEVIYHDSLHIEKHIHYLAIRYPLESFVQAAGFGDGKIFQQLFLNAYKQFGERYQLIDWSKQIACLIETKLPVQVSNWENEFRSFVIDSDYTTALELLKDLRPSATVQLMSHLLNMLIDRLNFSFKEALVHLNKAEKSAGTHPLLIETKQILLRLLSENKKISDLELVVELYRQLDLYLDINDVPSFLVRFYRAREAVLYYLLHHAQTIPFTVKKKKSSTIYEVIEELEDRYSEKELDGFYGVYFYLKSQNVARLLETRNRSFLGHSRLPVDINTMWTHYYGTSNVTSSKAKKRFLTDTSFMFRDLGEELDENLHQINEWILSISSLACQEEKNREITVPSSVE